jgi:integrase
MHKLFDLATLWEYLPLERRNPIEIVKIKNVTMRSKESVVLSPDQFRDVVKRLPENVNMIAVTMGCLGLRVSEALGLKWSDIDWELQTVTIRRSAYRGAIDETKTTSSKAKLPLHPVLAELLVVWKTKGGITEAETAFKKSGIFANPSTDMPYHVTQPAATLDTASRRSNRHRGLGFHSLRHSYRSWLDSAGIAPGVTKDLMRHSAISRHSTCTAGLFRLKSERPTARSWRCFYPRLPSFPLNAS